MYFLPIYAFSSEIHRVRRRVGSREEGPADAGGVPGAAGETAGAQDEELL